MRIRRVSRSGTSPGKAATKEGNATLKVLDQPDQDPGGVGEISEDRPFGSLESMFEEISFGDFVNDQAQRRRRFMGRYDDLWQLSLADPLTGLANRMLLLDRLTRELTRRRRHGGCVVVSHIDLNNLKDINDQFGYTSGNEVLLGMTRRLTSMLRSEDTVSRVGESELVAVMTIENEEFAGPLMRRVREVLDNPISVSGGAVRVSTTLGTVTARNSESAEEVLARAGHAA
jgi:diguanylate cyclase (GGDEF)-like protein